MDYPNHNATFDYDDIFERQPYAKQAMKWIDAYPVDQHGYSLVIDAPWGVGKTTFLNMWRNDIKRAHPEYVAANPDFKPRFSVAKREVVYYNAWENDRSDDSFAPLLWSIVSTIAMDKYSDPQQQICDDAIYKAVNGIAEAVAAFNPTNLALQAAPAIAKSVKALVDIFTKGEQTPVSKIVTTVKEQQATRAAIRKALSELANACGTLYIMVDELDRCRPSFAIETLEAIYQYFGMPNIVFIFSVDMTQLSHAIAGRYGEGFSDGGYLNKYFNRILQLPAPTAHQMMRFADKHTNLHLECKDEFELIFRACGITPREIPVLYNNLIPFFTPYPLNNFRENLRSALAIITLLLLCTKRKMPETYKALLRGEIDKGLGRLLENPAIRAIVEPLLPYMQRRVLDCYNEWLPVISECQNIVAYNSLSSEQMTASVGYALYRKGDRSTEPTFGMYLQKIFEFY